jgi:hypothetical protein
MTRELELVYSKLSKYLNETTIELIRQQVANELHANANANTNANTNTNEANLQFLDVFSLLNILYLLGAVVALGALSVFWRVAEQVFGAAGSVAMAAVYFCAFYFGANSLEEEMFGARRALYTCALAMAPFGAYGVSKLLNLDATSRQCKLLMSASTCAAGYFLPDEFLRLAVGWFGLGTVWLAFGTHSRRLRSVAMLALVACILIASPLRSWLSMSAAVALFPVACIFHIEWFCDSAWRQHRSSWPPALAHWALHAVVDAVLGDSATATLRAACALGAVFGAVQLVRRPPNGQRALPGALLAVAAAALSVAIGSARAPLLAAAVAVHVGVGIGAVAARRMSTVQHSIMFAFDVALLVSLNGGDGNWWVWRWLLVGICSLGVTAMSGAYIVERLRTRWALALAAAGALAALSVASPMLLALVYEAAVVLCGTTAVLAVWRNENRERSAFARLFAISLPFANALLSAWAQSSLVYWLAVAQWCATFGLVDTRYHSTPATCGHLALAGAVAAASGALVGGSCAVFVGAVAIYAAVAIASHRIFKDSLLYPFVMLGLGAAIIYMGVLSQRHGFTPIDMSEALSARLPAAVAESAVQTRDMLIQRWSIF